ncbi:MAG: GGDEF domain-containing protein, partial [Sulfurimicrobium sp.]|nr:GGDEF domain-containing protein [Sulfurimicrobium sp.]
LDIDHFKQINDTHGHLAGDEVLRSLGSRIRDHIRPSDHAARYGGEEFAIILTETPYKSALVAAEQLRRHICSEPFTIGGGMSLDVTVSIGVAGYPEHGNTEVALVKSADDALYKAKNSGRNQVCGAAGLNASDIHQAPANG